MICWAVKKDTQRSRGLMVSGHLVNFLSSLAMMVFAFVGIYVCPNTFFPNGLTLGGKFFNVCIASISIIPTLLYLYFYLMAMKFAQHYRFD